MLEAANGVLVVAEEGALVIEIKPVHHGKLGDELRISTLFQVISRSKVDNFVQGLVTDTFLDVVASNLHNPITCEFAHDMSEEILIFSLCIECVILETNHSAPALPCNHLVWSWILIDVQLWMLLNIDSKPAQVSFRPFPCRNFRFNDIFGALHRCINL